jgi:hypothetical protein
MNYKAPTCILFNPKQNFHSFGYEAREYYQDNPDKQDFTKWFYFEHFKMMLFRLGLSSFFLLSFNILSILPSFLCPYQTYEILYMHVLNFYLTFQYTISVVNNTQSTKLATGTRGFSKEYKEKNTSRLVC